jgi:hypothetical protein
MIRIAIIGLFGACLFSGATYAAEPRQCELSSYSAQDCIDAQKTLIGRLEKKFAGAVDFSRDLLSVIRGLNLEVVRKKDGVGPKFTRLYETLAERLGVDRNEDDEERFPLIRSALSDPATLSSFYTLAKPVIRESIKRFAIYGFVRDTLSANIYLFTTPFATPVSSGAQEWYENFCYDPEFSDDDSKEKCAKLEWFPKRFKETYGLEPTGDSAWILSFLNRRYREGGMALVQMWQRMGTDFFDEKS